MYSYNDWINPLEGPVSYNVGNRWAGFQNRDWILTGRKGWKAWARKQHRLSVGQQGWCPVRLVGSPAMCVQLNATISSLSTKREVTCTQIT